MQSGGSADSQFNMLNGDDDYIAKNIDTIYLIVKKCFSSSTDDKLLFRALNIAFGPCLRSFAPEDLEEKLLKYSCPAAEKLFNRKLEEIETKKDETVDVEYILSDLLMVCQDVASFLINTFEYLTTEAVKLTKVKSILICAANVLCECYRHCANSEQCYGLRFQALTENLTSFFKKAQELQGFMLQLLSRVEVQNEENEINSLNNILTLIYKSGISLLNLDIKTMAELWKVYTNVLGKYSQYLKNLHEISIPISFLSMNIVNNLENFIYMNKIDPNEYVRTVKISCFILKLVVKFCDQFSGYLGECQESLVELLIFLNKISHPHLEILKLPQEINVDILKQMTIGVDPLLTHLINDDNFAEGLSTTLEKIKTDSSKRLGMLLVCCLIVKKLTFSSASTRKIWFSSDNNIMDWVFQIIEYSNYELCSNMKFPSALVPGKSRRVTDLYEYILTTSSTFMIMSTSKEFILIERLLLKYVLQINPWCSLLAIDIWCILARFADADVCYCQLNQLCQIYFQLCQFEITPRKLFLKSLIQRLIPLLSQKHLMTFCETYPPEKYSCFWHQNGGKLFSSSVYPGLKMWKECRISKKIDEYLSSDGNEFNFTELESALFGYNAKFSIDDVNLQDNVAKLWEFDSGKLISNPLHRKYLRSLSMATNSIISRMKSKNIFVILKKIKVLLLHASESCVLYCIEILRGLAKAVIADDSLQGSIFGLITDLFSELLIHKSAFIRVKIMEILADFASVTRHPELITSLVNKNSRLRSEFADYIQQKHPLKETDWNMSEFLKMLEGVAYVHVCTNYTFLPLTDIKSLEPSPKKIRLNNQPSENIELQRAISALQKQVSYIRRYSGDLSIGQKRDLKDVVDMLHRILDC